MNIEQFEDKALSHYSYALLSEYEHKIVLIDPSRNIEPYLNFAAKREAEITGVIETHPHADFVSGHLELHKTTGATIYCSKLVSAAYPHETFDDGDAIELGEIKLKAINTPGHSPDSISIVLEHEGKDEAVFTGDTLFIGDCGRPDLRENAGNITAKREELAAMMYHSLHEKLMKLSDDVWVYPAHGAGTLCGKALSDANRSTIGAEKLSNWALQPISEMQFIKTLLEDQPFIPKYFPYDVALNKHGAISLKTAIDDITVLPDRRGLDTNIIIVDTRSEKDFKNGHLPSSINIQRAGKFETWLGSIIAPDEFFYLTASNKDDLQEMISRCAKIGYESFIKVAFIFEYGRQKTQELDIDKFYNDQQGYIIIDLRNYSEVKEQSIFNHTINIPLPELRERLSEIPFDKPLVVHCAGGYRSAAGSSIINNAFKDKIQVYDLGEAVKNFTLKA